MMLQLDTPCSEGQGPHPDRTWHLESHAGSRPVRDWLQAADWEADLRLAAGSRHELHDAWIDTQDWRFWRAGWVLRLRRRSAEPGATPHVEAALLPHGAVAAAPRPAWRETLESGELTALRSAPGGVGRAVRLVAGRHTLHVLFETHTSRDRYRVERDAEPLGQLQLDRIVLPHPDRRHEVHAERVIVSSGESAQDPFGRFVAELCAGCDLVADATPVHAWAMHQLGLEPVAAPALGSTALEPGLPVAAAAYAVLRRHFAVFLAHEPGTRLGYEPEDLHQMRVATRRLRAALRSFDDVLPPRRAAWLSDELALVAAALGKVRDLDVVREHLQQLPEVRAGARQDLDALLAQRREVARGGLLEILNAPRYDRLVAVCTAALQRGMAPRSRAAHAPVARDAPERIARRRRRVRKLGDRIDSKSAPAVLHALRIRCKRLRDLVDSLADLYGAPARVYARAVVRLQDLLGLQQDAVVARALLDDLVRDVVPDADTLRTLEALVGHLEQRGRDARREIPVAYRGLRGKNWKALKAEMQRVRRTLERSERRAGAERASAPARTRRRGPRPTEAAAPPGSAPEPAPPGAPLAEPAGGGEAPDDRRADLDVAPPLEAVVPAAEGES